MNLKPPRAVRKEVLYDVLTTIDESAHPRKGLLALSVERKIT